MINERLNKIKSIVLYFENKARLEIPMKDVLEMDMKKTRSSIKKKEKGFYIYNECSNFKLVVDEKIIYKKDLGLSEPRITLEDAVYSIEHNGSILCMELRGKKKRVMETIYFTLRNDGCDDCTYLDQDVEAYFESAIKIAIDKRTDEFRKEFGLTYDEFLSTSSAVDELSKALGVDKEKYKDVTVDDFCSKLSSFQTGIIHELERIFFSGGDITMRDLLSLHVNDLQENEDFSRYYRNGHFLVLLKRILKSKD